jgi:hypothetical protein
MVSSGTLRHVALVVLTRATWRNVPEDAILHSHCQENLKSYMGLPYYISNCFYFVALVHYLCTAIR